jgi:MPBQ/MSBQ methyltransferase
VSELEAEVRGHLRRDYENVFTPDAIERHADDALGTATALELVELLRARMPDAARSLEVGSGFGSFVVAARNAGLDVRGIELAPRSRSIGRGGDSPSSGTTLLITCTSSATLAICRSPTRPSTQARGGTSSEHVENVPRALSEGSRVLSSGGHLLALAPNYMSFTREAHYHLPRLPLKPNEFACVNLRIAGRDPSFFREGVHPLARVGAMRSFRNARLVLRHPLLEKLDDPDAANRPMVRIVLRSARRTHAAFALKAALSAHFASPLTPTNFPEGTKPCRGR